MIKALGALAAVSVLACTAVASVGAGVLVVGPSGQGDSTTIQGAVTLAAEGDTIRIRAGTYTESTQYPFPWATWETYVAIDKDNLTFIGDSRDSVIIGPPTANFNYTTMEPKGFVSSGLFRLTIRNVTVRNCYDGFNADGDITLGNVATDSCEIGAVVRGTVGLLVTNSLFVGGDTGVLVAGVSLGPTILGCTFRDVGIGIRVINSRDSIVRGAFVDNVVVGIQFEQLASGIIDSCSVTNAENAGLSLASADSTTIVNCTLGPGANYTLLIDGGVTDISRSSFGIGLRNTMVFGAMARVQLTGSDIAVSHSTSIWCQPGSYIDDPPTLISMENNYWALPDSQSIADVVWDMNDDPTIKAIVDFMPFSLTSVPVEKTSIGSIKALFADPR